MICEDCKIDYPNDDTEEAKQNGSYIFEKLCLHCWTKSKKWEHDSRFFKGKCECQEGGDHN